MRYLCMIFCEESRLAALSPAERAALAAEAAGHDEELRRAGHLLFAQRLERPTAATTVRIRKGQVTTTDGPFAETKEQLGGFILLEARDLNEAIQLASRMPSARLGGVEVRPVVAGARRVGVTGIVSGGPP